MWVFGKVRMTSLRSDLNVSCISNSAFITSVSSALGVGIRLAQEGAFHVSAAGEDLDAALASRLASKRALFAAANAGEGVESLLSEDRALCGRDLLALDVVASGLGLGLGLGFGIAAATSGPGLGIGIGIAAAG